MDLTTRKRVFGVSEKGSNQPTPLQSIGPVKKNNLRKIVIIFLSIRLNKCFGCSKEPSHRDGSFEYQQHMFWLRNKRNIFSYALLSGGPDRDLLDK